MARVQRELCSLPERKQTARQGRLTVDADQRLGADQIARRPEQGMAPLHRPHLDSVDAVNSAVENRRIDVLDASSVCAESLCPDDQRQCDGVDAENQRPFLGDDVEQALNAIGVDCGDQRFVDRGDRALMAAGEGDEILVRLFNDAEPLAQMRHRPFFEGDHGRHTSPGYASSG